MIGFIDSGVGGIFVLKNCLELMPNLNVVYLADTKNLPYGNKSRKKLLIIAKKNCETLILKGCTTVVFACNTLTAVAITYCRKLFPFINFVGIEPAIKPALKKCNNVLVLLTKATYKYSKLVRNNIKNKSLDFAPQKNLAKDIERKNVKPLSRYFKNKKYDGVVLGCTHFNFIKKDILNYLQTQNIFEASLGVAKRILNFEKQGDKQKIKFIFTGPICHKKRYMNILKNEQMLI